MLAREIGADATIACMIALRENWRDSFFDPITRPTPLVRILNELMDDLSSWIWWTPLNLQKKLIFTYVELGVSRGFQQYVQLSMPKNGITHSRNADVRCGRCIWNSGLETDLGTFV